MTDAQFYYLTKDIASEDIEDKTIRENFTIATNELTEMIKSIPAQKQVLIIDACSSGSLVDDVLSQTRNLSSSQRRALDRMKDRTGMFILAGSAANKVSYEASQFGQGLLTYSLLLGMNGSALRDGQYVDVMQLFQFAADKVPEFAAFIGGMQRPVIATPSGTNSFDVGQLTPDVVIPMMEVKPLFVRSNFQEETTFADNLELADALDNRLMDISAQGKSASILFVNVKKYPNAYAIKGRYVIEKGVVKLKVNLFQGEILIKTFTVAGSMSNIEGLVDSILSEIE
ncbi:MAG: caspase family protein [Saprospiraceae bacterium]|nr:caspase family protein [Saprospiraceae bacterium]